MAKQLKGKVAVITGGAGEIGVAMAKTFIKEGAKVVIVDLEKEALKRAKDHIQGGDALSTIVADVTKSSDAKKYIKHAVDAFGGVDILCANAGIEGEVKPLIELKVEELEQVLDVNVKGVFLTLKHGIPQLIKRGGGSVVITSSVAGLQGSQGLTAYTTSKHAVIGMMRTAAQEYGAKGVRVNTINPGPVDSRMMRSIEEQAGGDQAKDVQEQYEAQIPLGRYAQEQDVANIALFLASDQSSYCSGGTYTVDGGLTS